jgi:hypothetical protein
MLREGVREPAGHQFIMADGCHVDVTRTAKASACGGPASVREVLDIRDGSNRFGLNKRFS